VDRLFDDKDNVTDMGRSTVGMMQVLLKNDKGVSYLGGDDKHRQWKIVAMGVKAGNGKDFVMKHLDSYNANKGTADTAGVRWADHIGTMSKRGWAKQELQEFGVRNPGPQMITRYLEEYSLDLVAFGNDFAEADNSARARMFNGKTIIGNSVIHGPEAARMNSVTDWKFDEFINKAENINMMTAKYGHIMGAKPGDKKQYRKSTDVPNLRWYTKPGYPGMFARSPSSNNEMHISEEEMLQSQRIIKRTAAAQKAILQSESVWQNRYAEDTALSQATGMYYNN
jgi:hypothetical protein